MKIPLARAKAVTESLPTLVCECRVFLRIRRTHATGGSNSTADGGDDAAAAAPAVAVLDAAASLAAPVVGADALAVAVAPVVLAATGALLPVGRFSLEADFGEAAVASVAAGGLIALPNNLLLMRSGSGRKG